MLKIFFYACTGKPVDVILTSHAKNHRLNQIYQVIYKYDGHLVGAPKSQPWNIAKNNISDNTHAAITDRWKKQPNEGITVDELKYYRRRKPSGTTVGSISPITHFSSWFFPNNNLSFFLFFVNNFLYKNQTTTRTQLHTTNQKSLILFNQSKPQNWMNGANHPNHRQISIPEAAFVCTTNPNQPFPFPP